MALTTPCPTCGNLKNPNAKQCKPCSSETIRRKLTGVNHSPERRANISAGKRAQIAADGRVFDIAGYMADKPHPFALPTGTERIVKDGRVQVKCDDGKWRYRSRLLYEAHHGPITSATIIHHKDHDPMNDDIRNLQAMTRAEHARHHQTRKGA